MVGNRGELELSYLGFNDQFNDFLKSDRQNNSNKPINSKSEFKIFSKKIKIGLIYQKYLYDSLNIVLQKLNQKGASDNERIFVENFCAIAYFKIPEFRVKILSCITKTNDIDIPEWRGTEYKLDENFENKTKKYNLFISLFDWEQEFYRFLKVYFSFYIIIFYFLKF